MDEALVGHVVRLEDADHDPDVLDDDLPGPETIHGAVDGFGRDKADHSKSSCVGGYCCVLDVAELLEGVDDVLVLDHLPHSCDDDGGLGDLLCQLEPEHGRAPVDGPGGVVGGDNAVTDARNHFVKVLLHEGPSLIDARILLPLEPVVDVAENAGLDLRAAARPSPAQGLVVVLPVVHKGIDKGVVHHPVHV